jgi:hypothetical protein
MLPPDNLILIMNLTEKSITSADTDRLGLCVVCERILAEFSADTALLEATEWQLVVQHVVLVDPDGAGLERTADTKGSVDVLSVDGGCETVCGSVTELYC